MNEIFDEVYKVIGSFDGLNALSIVLSVLFENSLMYDSSFVYDEFSDILQKVIVSAKQTCINLFLLSIDI